jgi:hypothetical protein
MTEPHFPPPSTLEGYLTFLYRVTLYARIMGWDHAPHDQIADLMDAVHNLPHLLSHWDQFDQVTFRQFLVSYDAKWHREGESVSLLGCLEDCLANSKEGQA